MRWLLVVLLGSVSSPPSMADRMWVVSVTSEHKDRTVKGDLKTWAAKLEYSAPSMELSAEYSRDNGHTIYRHEKLELVLAHEWVLGKNGIFTVENELELDLYKHKTTSSLTLGYKHELRHGLSYSLKLESEYYPSSRWVWNDSVFSPAIEYKAGLGNSQLELIIGAPMKLYDKKGGATVELKALEYELAYVLNVSGNQSIKFTYQLKDSWRENGRKEELALSVKVTF
ncbi:hypothetical protein [Pseudoteredinibacter isoporae]|nr:hypothetical protein [Pseudoteredinibacter isoporae]